MSDYKTIIVGTDGSKSSLLAVERAVSIATAFDTTLVIGCAYYETAEDTSKTLRQDSVRVLGDDPAQENLAATKEAAEAIGATKIEIEVRSGSPVETLMPLVTDRRADLLVVSNRDISSLTDRLLGFVPADVTRQSSCDVTIVHTAS